MFNSSRPQKIRSQLDSHRRTGVAALVLMLAFAFAATALAAAAPLTLGSASNSTLNKQIVVNPQGRTLYTLSPETKTHLLCKSKECLKRWPPLTVASARTRLKAVAGVQGGLGLLKRANGSFQVTLRGLPLYRYAGDSAKGQVNGEAIESFGGTWHAIAASSGSPSTPTAPAPTGMPSAPSTPPSYTYPSY